MLVGVRTYDVLRGGEGARPVWSSSSDADGLVSQRDPPIYVLQGDARCVWDQQFWPKLAKISNG